MNKLILKMAPPELKKTTVELDGKEIILTKQNNGEYAVAYLTEKDSVELTVYKRNEASGKQWFFWAFLFFVIGFFGIFARTTIAAAARLNIN